MRTYRTQVEKREVSVSRFESIVTQFRTYGRKCRNFYKLTTMMT
ncbi:hypothetical protein [Nonlabens antarcticus]|nr:hypothetical protein [Nonlabens antarcticus]